MWTMIWELDAFSPRAYGPGEAVGFRGVSNSENGVLLPRVTGTSSAVSYEVCFYWLNSYLECQATQDLLVLKGEWESGPL